MDANIYYNHKNEGLFITSDSEKVQKEINLGLYSNTNFEKIHLSNLDQYTVKGIGFDKVDDTYFQNIKYIFSKYEFEVIAFHRSNVNIDNIKINTKNLIIGNSSKINFGSEHFSNLKEISFLSVKTFKGRILDKINSVEKLILWYENKKSNEILLSFPNLKEFYIYNGTIIELNLTKNPLLEKLQLHRCTKLENVIVHPEHCLKKVIVESSNKLDTGNLGNNVLRR